MKLYADDLALAAEEDRQARLPTPRLAGVAVAAARRDLQRAKALAVVRLGAGQPDALRVGVLVRRPSQPISILDSEITQNPAR